LKINYPQKKIKQKILKIRAAQLVEAWLWAQNILGCRLSWAQRMSPMEVLGPRGTQRRTRPSSILLTWPRRRRWRLTAGQSCGSKQVVGSPLTLTTERLRVAVSNVSVCPLSLSLSLAHRAWIYPSVSLNEQKEKNSENLTIIRYNMRKKYVIVLKPSIYK
jgi:hypothetical protein